MKRLLCIILTSLLLSTSVWAAADFVSFAGRPPCRHGQSLRSDYSSHRRQKPHREENSSRANRGKPRQQPLQLFWCKQVSFAPKLNFGKKMAQNSV